MVSANILGDTDCLLAAAVNRFAGSTSIVQLHFLTKTEQVEITAAGRIFGVMKIEAASSSLRPRRVPTPAPLSRAESQCAMPCFVQAFRDSQNSSERADVPMSPIRCPKSNPEDMQQVFWHEMRRV